MSCEFGPAPYRGSVTVQTLGEGWGTRGWERTKDHRVPFLTGTRGHSQDKGDGNRVSGTDKGEVTESIWAFGWEGCPLSDEGGPRATPVPPVGFSSPHLPEGPT